MIICICGKSGSGKSTIAELIENEIPNSIHVDIDKIAHQSHNDEITKEKLINIFGFEILTNGNIDRKKLGKIVFTDKEKMKTLKVITWNYMEKEIDNIINNNKDKTIILDYLLLPKTKYFDNCDFRILVDTPYKIRKQRVLLRDNITEEQFDLRDNSSIKYDKNKFDYIVNEINTKEIKRKVFKYE